MLIKCQMQSACSPRASKGFITTSLEELSLEFEENLSMLNKLGGLQDGRQWENKKSWSTYVPWMHNFELTATGVAGGLSTSIATRPNSSTRHQRIIDTSQTMRLQSAWWEWLKARNEPSVANEQPWCKFRKRYAKDRGHKMCSWHTQCLGRWACYLYVDWCNKSAQLTL